MPPVRNELSCLFCKIAKNEERAQVVFEDKKTISFLDTRPISKGHTLVVPKCHYRNLLELPQSEVTALFSAVRKVASKVKVGLNSDGLNIGLNEGAAAGQIIFHLHVHIIPRNFGDDVRFGNRLQLSDQEFSQFRNRIANAVG